MSSYISISTILLKAWLVLDNKTITKSLQRSIRALHFFICLFRLHTNGFVITEFDIIQLFYYPIKRLLLRVLNI